MDLIEFGLSNPIRHWYYAHKFWFIKSADVWRGSNNSLVDIGAGSALFSKELLKINYVNKVVAVDTNYPVDLKSDLDGIKYVQSTKYSGFTHFLLTDVLEHVADDSSFLKSITSQSDHDATFIITVPALMSLWSGHDIYLKHFRRYTLTELNILATEAGIDVFRIRYTYSTVFPLAWIQRKLKKSQREESQLEPTGKLTSFILKFLLLFDRYMSFIPFGVSLLLIGKKN